MGLMEGRTQDEIKEKFSDVSERCSAVRADGVDVHALVVHIVAGNADLRSGSACQLEGLAFGAGCEFHVDAYPVRLYGRTQLTLPDTESPSSRRAVSPGRRT